MNATQINQEIEATIAKVGTGHASWAHNVLHRIMVTTDTADTVLAQAVAKWLPGYSLFRSRHGRTIAASVTQAHETHPGAVRITA